MAIQENADSVIETPAPTAWPMILALGLTLAFAGLVTNIAVSMVGFILTIAGAVGWFREVLPDEHRETVRVEAALEAIVPAKIGVDYLQVGELGNRAILPLEIYPYSAGIKGGIAGGVVMAVLAVLQGIALHGSPWYTVNILAATAMSNLANANTATLSSFIPQAFVVALIIHASASILVGLLYGVMLPMFPRYPAFWAAIVAPLLWTGLLWSSLSVINPAARRPHRVAMVHPVPDRVRRRRRFRSQPDRASPYAAASPIRRPYRHRGARPRRERRGPGSN